VGVLHRKGFLGPTVSATKGKKNKAENALRKKGKKGGGQMKGKTTTLVTRVKFVGKIGVFECQERKKRWQNADGVTVLQRGSERNFRGTGGKGKFRARVRARGVFGELRKDKVMETKTREGKTKGLGRYRKEGNRCIEKRVGPTKRKNLHRRKKKASGGTQGTLMGEQKGKEKFEGGRDAKMGKTMAIKYNKGGG